MSRGRRQEASSAGIPQGAGVLRRERGRDPGVRPTAQRAHVARLEEAPRQDLQPSELRRRSLRLLLLRALRRRRTPLRGQRPRRPREAHQGQRHLAHPRQGQGQLRERERHAHGQFTVYCYWLLYTCSCQEMYTACCKYT